MRPRLKNALTSAACVTVAAVAGAIATDPGSQWYARLRKPAWQPPPPAFALVWTPLYGAIAYAGGRALNRAGAARAGFLRAFTADLALNAAWTLLFFRARRPRVALADLVALDLANLALVRRAWRADRAAGALLAPYAAWGMFATALNAEIVRLNPGASGRPAGRR